MMDVEVGGKREGVEVGGKIYALCEMVLEDLNNYAECMIPIGTSTSHTAELRREERYAN
jgi:hypothetical protein